MPALPAVSAEHRQRMREVSHRLSEVYGVPQWRQPLPAVDELVCTFLSQNTNDVNRDKAFSALKAHYPTWEAVRDADPQELIDVIRTAGLANQKGPRIQAALKAISVERGEISLEWLRDLPTDQARDWLVNLKGVGPKTAAIVLVFSLGMPAFPVDTHIYRVSGRIGCRSDARLPGRCGRSSRLRPPAPQPDPTGPRSVSGTQAGMLALPTAGFVPISAKKFIPVLSRTSQLPDE